MPYVFSLNYILGEQLKWIIEFDLELLYTAHILCFLECFVSKELYVVSPLFAKIVL
jgi:hypothetical protein